MSSRKTACGSLEPRRISRSWLVHVILVLAVSACAPVTGRPARITFADVRNPVCPSNEDVATFEGLSGTKRGGFRDNIIRACVEAYNGRFNQFTSELSGGAVTTNLIGDVASGTLTTIAGVAAPKTAKRLGTIAGVVLGIQGAVNNDLYANKTISALIAAMQVKRLQVMTEIIKAEISDPAGETYSLSRAAFDLSRYEDAGTLYTGIAELNKAATEAAASAATDLANAQRTPTLTVDVASRDVDANKRLALMASKIKAIPDTAGGRKKLDAIASALLLKTNAADKTDLKIGYIIAELIRELTVFDKPDQPKAMDGLEAKLNPLLL